ncbi:MAG: hypothetical protein RL167_916 [Actinomycetota bacterium]|jgi:MFS family permease
MQPLTKARANAIKNAITLMFVVQGICSTTHLPRIPDIIDQIDVSLATWGIIIGIGGFGSLLGLSITNQLIAAFGTTRVTLYSAFMMAGSIASFSLMHDPFVFLIAYLANSFSGGVLGIALNAQAITFQSRVGRVILGRFHGAWSLGAGFSAILSGFFATFMPLWIHLTIIPALAIVAYVFAARNMLKPSEESHDIGGSTRKALNIFKAPKAIWIITFAAFCSILPEVAIMDWSAVFGRKELGLTAGLAAVPYIAFSVAMIIGRLSIEKLTKRIPLARLARRSIFMGACAFALSIVLGPLVAEADKFAGMIVLATLWFVVGLGFAPAVPTVFGTASFIKGFNTAQVMAIMSLINTFNFMFAKMLIGAVAQGVSLQIALIFPMLLAFTAAFMVGVVAKRQPKTAPLENAFPTTGPVTAID